MGSGHKQSYVAANSFHTSPGDPERLTWGANVILPSVWLGVIKYCTAFPGVFWTMWVELLKYADHGGPMLQLEGRAQTVLVWTGLPVCVCLLFTLWWLLAALKTDTNGRHWLKCLPACDLSPLVHKSVSQAWTFPERWLPQIELALHWVFFVVFFCIPSAQRLCHYLAKAKFLFRMLCLLLLILHTAVVISTFLPTVLISANNGSQHFVMSQRALPG